MPSQAEFVALKAWQRWHADLVRDASTTAAFLIQGRQHRLISGDVWAASGLDAVVVVEVPHEVIMARAPTRGPDVTVEEVRSGMVPSPASSGISEARSRAIAQEEDGKLKVTK